MKKTGLLYLLLIIISAHSWAQPGKITGKVINVASGMPMQGATLILVETSRSEIADLNGNFSFTKLKAGIYTIKCSYTGYAEKTVDSVVVTEESNAAITPVIISMIENTQLAGVEIKSIRTRAAGETVASLLIAQKNMANVSDGITAETIRKTPDRSTSDVLKRVSGASIQDDRFAIIRGLNDRYNAAFINGAPLPSTESDRKAFAFDIFPSSILDNIVIYKTATPDKTGDFAGGIIEITTKSILPKSFIAVSFGGSLNSLSTGKTRYYSETQGRKDWIGQDDGIRGIPAGLPSVPDLQAGSPETRAEAAKLFRKYKWGIRQTDAAPNYNFQLSKGINIEKNQKEFIGALFSVNYTKNYTFTTSDKNTYDFDRTAPNFNPEQRNKFRDSIYNAEVIVALLGNLSVRIDNRNSISWKNNMSINTDNKLIMRIGSADHYSDSLTFVRDRVRWYSSNLIYSSQLLGEHQVGKKKTKINWLASYSKVKREIPNLSRTSYAGFRTDYSTVSALIPFGVPIQTAGNGTMFFVNSIESMKSFKADITQPYTLLGSSQNIVKIGGGYQYRERNFQSRLLAFQKYDPAGSATYDESLTSLPDDQIFLPAHMGLMKNGSGGFLLTDGTPSSAGYDASSALTHVYVMSDQRFLKDFRLIYGLRIERFHQELNSMRNADPVIINTVITDYLPSANLVYALTPTMNLRLSYSKTINRPEFRELAPFIFFDYVSNLVYEGQETLKRAKITNYDFRYEFYPGKAQLFSVSAFYKDIINPIEIIAVPNTSIQTIYNNAVSGKIYGVEVEFRTLLSTVFGSKSENGLLSKFTLTGNGAITKSNVILGPLFGFPASQLIKERPLQGQSPYVINGSIGFNDDKLGLTSTVSVNRIGDRINIGGAYNKADIFEKARTVVDFQLAKSFLNNAVELKFTARDILAQEQIFYFDYDQNESYSANDKPNSTYIMPKVFSFNVTYKF